MKKIFAIMGVAAVAGLWVWFDAAQARRAAATEQAALARRQQALAADLRQWQGKLATATRPPPSPAIPASTPPPAKEATPAPPPGAIILPAQATRAQKIAADPQLQILDRERQRAQIALDHAEFFAMRGVSAQQLERFTAAKLKREEANADLAAVGAAQDAGGQRAVATLRQQAQAEHDREIAAALGPETNTALQEYEQTRTLRTTLVHPVVAAATFAGVPLTGEQVDRLTQAALAAAGGEARAFSSKMDLAALDAQARDILSPAQFEVYLRGNSARKNLEQSIAAGKMLQIERQRNPPPARPGK